MTRGPAPLALVLGTALLLGACSGSPEESPSSSAASSRTSSPTDATSSSTSSEGSETSSEGSETSASGAGGGLDCGAVTPDELEEWVGFPVEVSDLSGQCNVLPGDEADLGEGTGFSLSWGLAEDGTSVEDAAASDEFAGTGAKTESRTLDDGTKATLVTLDPAGASGGNVYLFAELDGGLTLTVLAADLNGDRTDKQLTTIAEDVAQAYTS
ncbi:MULTISPECIES: hypothetical protein [Janibacter]|uniref:DUF3558 domain-containing protein n=1 Tax=Janibacter hoylei PVAS-1 TaxID=1210046 RepID=K1ETJ0_9MICO|nr:hypothetical protein [Janibacter hoylei]EKA62458.1 hypothetical protein B277_02034 [Janibacter hoylei PVAS-1]MCT1618267.1 hypothetical protein [Janibacter hoylei]MCT2293706.1 hypothetical protein [Janibacter hoylei]RWU83055.1 hypothetical protein CWN80_09665 [Janibacter hoylei PVAS-1]